MKNKKGDNLTIAQIRGAIKLMNSPSTWAYDKQSWPPFMFEGDYCFGCPNCHHYVYGKPPIKPCPKCGYLPEIENRILE